MRDNGIEIKKMDKRSVGEEMCSIIDMHTSHYAYCERWSDRHVIRMSLYHVEIPAACAIAIIIFFKLLRIIFQVFKLD